MFILCSVLCEIFDNAELENTFVLILGIYYVFLRNRRKCAIKTIFLLPSTYKFTKTEIIVKLCVIWIYFSIAGKHCRIILGYIVFKKIVFFRYTYFPLWMLCKGVERHSIYLYLWKYKKTVDNEFQKTMSIFSRYINLKRQGQFEDT